jgi:hypothetical protein
MVFILVYLKVSKCHRSKNSMMAKDCVKFCRRPAALKLKVGTWRWLKRLEGTGMFH